MAGLLRIPGSELGIPDGLLKPRCFSTGSGDEFPLALMYHPIDLAFDFYTANGAAPPATGIWLVLSPRAAGFITAAAALIVANGTSTSLVINVLKNGADQATDLTVTHSTTENAWQAITLTGGSFAFVADDLIAIDLTNTAATGATGLKVRLQGYYVGD